MITKSEAGPNAWAFSCSKKVDDISKHESKHDPKYDPNHGSKKSPEGGGKPEGNQDPGTKPTPGIVKK